MSLQANTLSNISQGIHDRKHYPDRLKESLEQSSSTRSNWMYRNNNCSRAARPRINLFQMSPTNFSWTAKTFIKARLRNGSVSPAPVGHCAGRQRKFPIWYTIQKFYSLSCQSNTNISSSYQSFLFQCLTLVPLFPFFRRDPLQKWGYISRNLSWHCSFTNPTWNTTLGTTCSRHYPFYSVGSQVTYIFDGFVHPASMVWLMGCVWVEHGKAEDEKRGRFSGRCIDCRKEIAIAEHGDMIRV